MNWSPFVASKAQLPDLAVSEYIKGFEAATSGQASLGIIPLGEFAIATFALPGHFLYRVSLYSKFLEGYEFEIFTLAYDVQLYPAKFFMPEDIRKELKGYLFRNLKHSLPPTVLIDKEADILKLIVDIAKTDKFNRTVGGLLALVKSRRLLKNRTEIRKPK